MSNYTPEVNADTGEINFPPIKQDNTEVYLHNLAESLDELNEPNPINQPWHVLIIGRNVTDSLALAESDYTEKHYSHELIKNIVVKKQETSIVRNREDVSYGNTNLIHLYDTKKGEFLYENNIQYSFALSSFDPHEEVEEYEEIEYGVGELDEYVRPGNIAAKSLYNIVNTHEKDEEAHDDVNPSQLIRKRGMFYQEQDRVWALPDYHPNYIYLEAYEAGVTDADKYDVFYEEPEVPDTPEELDTYTKPSNIAYKRLAYLVNKHFSSYDSHDNIIPSFLLRRKHKDYTMYERVWTDPNIKPNYKYLEATNDGTTGDDEVVI